MRRRSPRRAARAAAVAALTAALAAAGCTPGPTAPPAANTQSAGSQSAGSQDAGSRDPGSQNAPAAPRVAGRIDAGLAMPWSTVFLPDGTALISERDSGLVKAVPPRGSASATTVGKVPGVVPGGEGGLLGLALSMLVREPEVYGVQLSPVANAPYFTSIELTGSIDIGQLAASAGVDEAVLLGLNPAFLRKKTVDGPSHLLVPRDQAAQLSASLSKMGPYPSRGPNEALAITAAP